MNPKTILTEKGWGEVGPDCKGKDKELRKSLSSYSSLKEDDFDSRCKALIKIAALAGTLKVANEVKGDKDAVRYLTDVINAAKAKQSELAKAEAEAEKAKTMTAKKVELEAKKQEQEEEGGEEDEEEEEEEEEEGDSLKKLTNALKTLKLAKKPYYFLVCDAKPYGLIVSKKDIRKNAQARKELAQIAGGSTRPPKFGECRCDSGKYVFEMEKPPSGLARILQKWIKTSTGLGLKIMVGTESAEDEEGSPEGERPTAPETETALLPVSPKLAKAPEVWRATQRSVTAGVQQLQAAVRKSLQGESPALVKEVEENVAALDGLSEMLGDDLPEFLNRAIAAKDVANRTAQLKEAKTLLVAYLQLAKGQGAELIAHIDSNPFGVKTNLKKTLTDGLTQMAEAIGTPA